MPLSSVAQWSQRSDIRVRQDKIWTELDSMPGIDLRVETQITLKPAIP